MVSVIISYALKALNIAKNNPIKVISISALVGCAFGLYFLGESIVSDYNATKEKIVQVELSNAQLKIENQNLQDINNEILERISEVEAARDKIEVQIEESQERIEQYRRDLRNLDLESVTAEEGSEKVNLIWNQTIECLERASRGEAECELSLPQ